MEGIPRIPMLSIEQKPCGGPISFRQPIQEYIVVHYQDDPERYEHAIQELEDLREKACTVGADDGGLKILYRYYCQLQLLKNRFPMEVGDPVALPFTWLEKFSDMASSNCVEDVGFEEACILLNIGATHSILAAAESRSTPESMKSGCSHLQQALFAFNKLKEYPSYSADMDKSLIGWFATLMQAQAQECILEKSIIDHRKPGIVAKVAMQIAQFYKTSTRILESSVISDIVGNSKVKSWKKFTGMKQEFYSAIAHFYMGEKADEEKKMGEKVAWLNEAHTHLTEAFKLAHKETSSITDTLAFANDVITGRKENAVKENDFIYHERTSGVSLEIEGVSLVKPIPFDPTDEKVVGVDIFASLLPISVHSANSMYSETKANKLREIMEKVEEKNDKLRKFLESLDVSSLELESDAEFDIPEQLLERSAALNAQPESFTNLMASLQRLQSCYKEANGKISNLRSEIHQLSVKLSDKKKEGIEWKDLAEKIEGLIRGLDRFTEKQNEAVQNNEQLHRAVTLHSPSIQTLSLPLDRLKLAIPSLTPNDKSDEVTNLKRLLGKVDEMKVQRAELMEQLRAHLHADDITNKLLTLKNPNLEEVFGKEMEKHDRLIGILNQNLSAQENILAALVDANAKFADGRRLTLLAQKERNDTVESLIRAYDVYIDVMDKSEKGRKFYEKLLEGLGDLEDLLETVDSELNTRQAPTTTLPPPAPSNVQESQISPAPPAGHPPSSRLESTRERPAGPRLEDYMDFYRAKSGGKLAPTTSLPNTSDPSIGRPLPPNQGGAYGAMHDAPVTGPYHQGASYIQQPSLSNPRNMNADRSGLMQSLPPVSNSAAPVLPIPPVPGHMHTNRPIDGSSLNNPNNYQPLAHDPARSLPSQSASTPIIPSNNGQVGRPSATASNAYCPPYPESAQTNVQGSVGPFYGNNPVSTTSSNVPALSASSIIPHQSVSSSYQQVPKQNMNYYQPQLAPSPHEQQQQPQSQSQPHHYQPQSLGNQNPVISQEHKQVSDCNQSGSYQPPLNKPQQGSASLPWHGPQLSGQTPSGVQTPKMGVMGPPSMQHGMIPGSPSIPTASFQQQPQAVGYLRPRPPIRPGNTGVNQSIPGQTLPPSRFLSPSTATGFPVNVSFQQPGIPNQIGGAGPAMPISGTTVPVSLPPFKPVLPPPIPGANPLPLASTYQQQPTSRPSTVQQSYIHQGPVHLGGSSVGQQQNNMNPAGQQQYNMNPVGHQQNNMNPAGHQQNNMNPSGQQNNMNPTGQQQNNTNAAGHQQNNMNPSGQQNNMNPTGQQQNNTNAAGQQQNNMNFAGQQQNSMAPTQLQQTQWQKQDNSTFGGMDGPIEAGLPEPMLVPSKVPPTKIDKDLAQVFSGASDSNPPSAAVVSPTNPPSMNLSPVALKKTRNPIISDDDVIQQAKAVNVDAVPAAGNQTVEELPEPVLAATSLTAAGGTETVVDWSAMNPPDEICPPTDPSPSSNQEYVEGGNDEGIMTDVIGAVKENMKKLTVNEVMDPSKFTLEGDIPRPRTKKEEFSNPPNQSNCPTVNSTAAHQQNDPFQFLDPFKSFNPK